MYLLDTNVCIEITNGSPATVRKRFQHAVEAGTAMHVSSVSTFELWYGVAKSGRPEFNRRRVASFLAGPLTILTFDEADSAQAGEVRAALEKLGTPIGPYDLLLAGQALARGLVLVTANVGEFSRVAGLRVESWQ